MEKTNVEHLFEWIDQTTELIQQHLEVSYLDGLQETLESLFYQESPENIDDLLKQKMEKALAEIKLDVFSSSDIQKAISFAILKGMKDSSQQQHQQTPESVALLAGYLAQKVTKNKEGLRIFDPACGTSNLLITVLKQLEQSTAAYGSEIDQTLIKLSLLSANLQKIHIEFFHQDSIRPFLLDPVDLIVSDLPVGYYPDDIRAADYELKADKGHSYAHHLFIEQCMNYVVDGGYLVLIVPNFLFDSDQADKLHGYLQQKAHIVGLLSLPESAFKSEKHAKSILLLQKNGEHTTPIKQPLFVKLPSFKNAQAMDDILNQINGWFADHFA